MIARQANNCGVTNILTATLAASVRSAQCIHQQKEVFAHPVHRQHVKRLAFTGQLTIDIVKCGCSIRLHAACERPQCS